MSQFLFQPEKVLDSRQGTQQIIANIEVCEGISTILSTTLGPYGLDKLFYGKTMLLTNDGATILQNLPLTHPVARMIVSLSKSQDKEVGDGTTSVVILTAEILSNFKKLLEEGFSIDKIRRTLQDARIACVAELENLKIEFSQEALLRLACTCLNSKILRNYKNHFATMLVEGLSYEDDLNIEKIPGGSLNDSILVNGIAFEKTFTYAGYEQQPKKIINPKICCLNVELEWRSERDNAEMRIESVEEYQKVVDAEWCLIKDKLDDIVESGANVVLSSLPIGDFATQYFASKGIFSAGRVKGLDAITKSFKGRITNSTKMINLATCDLFEERQLGNARYNYFEGKNALSHTLILRGPGKEILDEVERSVHDAICVIRVAMSHKSILCGGGSVEMQLSKLCRSLAFSKGGDQLFVYRQISKAFEKIPFQLATNFGIDSILTLQNLRRAHATNSYSGVSLKGVADMNEAGIYEPLEVKKNMIKAAFNAASAILSIDATIISKK